MKMHIPRQCKEILGRFADYHLQAYLVGGCVRDSLLGKEPKDWDICTEALPEQVLEIFKDCKVILTGLQHGTVTVMLGGMPVEITTYRIDGAYEDNRHPKEVFFTSELQEDLSRRDFTINALAYHPDEGVIDYFDGLGDLERGIIRCVGDAASRYQEDGLRIMRAIRFACVLNFQFEAETENAIRKYSYLLRNIARERIQVEFDKILTSSWADYGLETLARLDCFPYFLPELCHTWQFAQNGGQHQYDVFTHSLKAVALVPPTVVLRLTMLLHDIAKPFVWKQQEEKDLFDGHSEMGAQLAGRILERLRYDKKTIAQVQQLIGQHERLLKVDEICLRQAAADLGFDGVRNLIAVKRADVRAHSDAMAQMVLEPFDQMEALLDRIEQRGDCCSLKQLAVSGRDLTALGYKGRQIGNLLNQLLQLVLENPACNNREYLLNQVKEEVL
ncbi:MAG: HD domain-containing protein [Peptococcaceae bacterium]|nr:HD domain-containing protein [Peptococcaceae bacterium]